MPLNLLRTIYKSSLRAMLPRIPVHYAGLRVPVDKRLGDDLINRLRSAKPTGDRPNYETGLVAGLRAGVRPGDRVVVIGGGIGVTAALAAQLAGPQGHVTCYEGGTDQIPKVEATLAMNGVRNRVTVHHAIVAGGAGVYGDSDGAARVAPQELPACDVLELDCEGAETEILTHMAARPREVLVECHGFRGAPTGSIRSLLDTLGYDVEDLGVAEIDKREFCEKNDIRVLAGRQRP